jgi:hypothetical protein
MSIADMRHVVAAIDDRPRHSGGGCTLSKHTPRGRRLWRVLSASKGLLPRSKALATMQGTEAFTKWRQTGPNERERSHR